MASLKLMNNEMAVSPIVATLVLIVVAVIGAVAVGTIMGTFSSDVSKQANANGAGAASQNEILVAGSTTIDPITQAAAKMYTAKNPGVKITSQAMGSGAGVQAVGNGVADIGAASEAIKSSWTTQFPNLQKYQIGEGAIVVITNKAKPAIALTTAPSYTDLQGVFSDGKVKNSSAIGPDPIPYAIGAFNANTAVITRADGSGTADSFYQNYLGFNRTPTSSGNANVQSVNGNAALIAAVGATDYAIGFADYGDTVANIGPNGAKTVAILPIQDLNNANTYTMSNLFDTSANVTANFNNLRTVAKYIYQTSVEQGATPTQGTNKYPITLFRPLYYVTNGAPSSTVQDFINFVEAQPYDTNTKTNVFQETNNFCVADIA